MYKDKHSGMQVPRTNNYSVPVGLHEHIDTIQPTTAFYGKIAPKKGDPKRKQQQSVKRAANCDPNNIIPACLQSYYNVDYTSSGKSTMAVTGFVGLYASHNDLDQFLSNYYNTA
jgi:tripeptidyl-peptidase-1